MTVYDLRDRSRAAFASGSSAVDAVLGARGSQLQLVLNALFHLETSTGNIPWKLYTALRDDARVERAAPTAVGDNYRGYRIVGTTSDFFEFKRPGGGPWLRLAQGQWFDASKREAVIGSIAARRTGLAINSTFRSYHGLTFDPSAEHPVDIRVVGILAPSNSPQDRAIFVPIETVFRMEGHVLRGGGAEYRPKETEEIPDEHKEVSAVIVKFKGPQAGFAFDQLINRQGNAATLAWPVARVMTEIFVKLGWMTQILDVIAICVAGVVFLSIGAIMYANTRLKAHDLAVLRSIGARRSVLAAAVWLEAMAVGVVGFVFGTVIRTALLIAASTVVRDRAGVVLDPWSWHPSLAAAPALLVPCLTLASILPALLIYRADVSAELAKKN